MIDVGFIRPAHAGIMIVDDRLDQLIARMTSYVPHKAIFAMTADDL
jgi:hypothetical protein